MLRCGAISFQSNVPRISLMTQDVNSIESAETDLFIWDLTRWLQHALLAADSHISLGIDAGGDLVYIFLNISLRSQLIQKGQSEATSQGQIKETQMKWTNPQNRGRAHNVVCRGFNPTLGRTRTDSATKNVMGLLKGRERARERQMAERAPWFLHFLREGGRGQVRLRLS